MAGIIIFYGTHQVCCIYPDPCLCKRAFRKIDQGERSRRDIPLFFAYFLFSRKESMEPIIGIDKDRSDEEPEQSARHKLTSEVPSTVKATDHQVRIA